MLESRTTTAQRGMRPRSSPPFSCPPRGFTLLELMLVLAIIVVVAAVTIPSVTGAFKNQSLAKAGDLVRDEFARARIHAMESGRAYEFVYTVGGNTFRVNPRASLQDSVEMSVDAANGTNEGSSNAAGNLLTPAPASVATVPATQMNVGGIVAKNTLVEGVRFAGGDMLVDTRASALDQQQSAASGVSTTTGTLGSGQAAPPIFFYPDGTTSNAQVILGNERGRYIVLRLRSLTGMCKVSELLTAEELPR